MRFASRLLSLLFIAHFAHGQGGTVKGMVRDPAGNPLPFANVSLWRAQDSSMVRATVTDTSGHYSFTNITKGEYYVTASFTGMQQVAGKFIEISTDKTEIDPVIIYLRRTEAELQAAQVTVKRLMVEQKADRLVIQVKNGIVQAGGTALDVLERSPGVTVDRQGNSIAINGKNGVNVMINGKISYMPVEALVPYLGGISAGTIEKIELITTPPAKYDAQGNAGYINIVLTHDPHTGFNGSYFLTAGYGKKETGAAGMNFNYRSARIDLYGNYTFNHDHYIQPSSGFVQFAKAGGMVATTSFSDRDAIRQVHNLRLGLDYRLDTATTIGVLVAGYNNHWSMLARNGSLVTQKNATDTLIHSKDDPEMNLWQNLMANINFQHRFQPGKTLFIDLNYIYYKDNNPNTYSTDYYNGNKELLYHEDVRSGKITPIQFRVLSADYTTPLGQKISMEAGGKVSLSSFTNDVTQDRWQQNAWVPDPAFASYYSLKENTGAAYASLIMKWNDRLSMTAGLRYEYTSSDLRTRQPVPVIARKYGELFPSFLLSQKLNGDSRINLSYSRRITRPGFNDLAPFTVFFDPKTFFAGNPTLQPAIANTVQAGYAFRSYSFTISYTHEANSIDNFYFQPQRIDTSSNVLYLSSRNFRYQRYLTAGLSLPFTLTRWWSLQNNINGDWRQISTANEGVPVLLQNFALSLNSTQRFVLPEEFSIELTGLYATTSYLGTSRRKPYYQVDAGVQKKLKGGRDLLRLAGNDIFNSGTYLQLSDMLPGGATVNRTFNFGTVAYRLTYTHNFGNHALKGGRERSTGAEEELKRVRN